MKVNASCRGVRVTWAASLVAGVAAVVVAGAGPASAGPRPGGPGGTPTDGGYGAYAVELRGDYSPSRKASVPAPPPLCWWEPWSSAGDPSDPEAVKEYWDTEVAPYLDGHASAGNLMIRGADDFDKAIEAAKDKGRYPNGITWYTMETNEAALRGVGDYDAQVQALVDAGCTSANRFAHGDGSFQVAVTHAWYATGDEPEPRVDPRTLAEYAYEVMDLVEPQLEWNPKIASRQSAALVNLPTWLWVDESTALGDGEGVRRVEAIAGSVQVVVEANTSGLRVTSPAGSRTCTLDEARTAYQRGRDEGGACTLAFTRGSYGYAQGFPVDASTVWDASWTSNTGEGDTLPSRTVSQTTFIPVAQSQALVTRVD